MKQYMCIFIVLFDYFFLRFQQMYGVEGVRDEVLCHFFRSFCQKRAMKCRKSTLIWPDQSDSQQGQLWNYLEVMQMFQFSGRGKNYKGRTRHFTSDEEIDRQMNDDSWRVHFLYFNVLSITSLFVNMTLTCRKILKILKVKEKWKLVNCLAFPHWQIKERACTKVHNTKVHIWNFWETGRKVKKKKILLKLI